MQPSCVRLSLGALCGRSAPFLERQAFLENNPNQQPVTPFNFMLRVVSVVINPNGETTVTFNATTTDVQPVSDGLVIRCRESVNLTHANATLRVTSELLFEGLQ